MYSLMTTTVALASLLCQKTLAQDPSEGVKDVGNYDSNTFMGITNYTTSFNNQNAPFQFTVVDNTSQVHTAYCEIPQGDFQYVPCDPPTYQVQFSNYTDRYNFQIQTNHTISYNGSLYILGNVVTYVASQANELINRGYPADTWPSTPYGFVPATDGAKADPARPDFGAGA